MSGNKHLISSCSYSSGCSWPLLLQVHAAGSHSACCPLRPPGTSQQNYPQTVRSQPITLQEALLPMCRTLHVSLLNLIRLLLSPFLQQVWVPPPSTILTVLPFLGVTCKLEERALHHLHHIIVRDTKQDRYVCNICISRIQVVHWVFLVLRLTKSLYKVLLILTSWSDLN